MSVAVVSVFDNVTGTMLGQIVIPDNLGHQSITDVRYMGNVRLETAVQPATPPLIVQGDAPQRSDIQAIGTHLFNLAANIERHSEALNTLTTKTVQIIQADHEYLRSELEYLRNRCRLLEAKLHLAGVHSPSPPFDEDSF